MKTYKPFRNNILVEKLEIKTSGLILPNQNMGKWVRLKVISIGPDVKEAIKPGMIVIAENMFEPVNLINKNIGLILSQYIHTEEVDDGQPTN